MYLLKLEEACNTSYMCEWHDYDKYYLYVIHTRVETRSGHLSHILSDSSRSYPLYKMGLPWILHWITMASGCDQSDELSMLDGDDGLKIFSKWVTD